MFKSVSWVLMIAMLTTFVGSAEAAKKVKGGKNKKKMSIEQRFMHADANQDGKLSPDEFSKFDKQQGQDSAKRFKKIDTDGDGFVTPAEFKAFVAARKAKK